MRLLETTPTHYRIAGLPPLVRVTSALSLVRTDLREIPPDILARAAQRGNAVHRGIWLLESGGDGSGLAWDTLEAELIPYVKAYQAAKDALRFDVLDKERLVVSTTYGYAGRADLCIAHRGAIGILDLKTGVAHPSHRLQVSAYVEAYKAQTSRRALHRWILYLRGDGTYRLDDCSTTMHAADFKVFAAILTAYRWMQSQNGETNGHQ